MTRMLALVAVGLVSACAAPSPGRQTIVDAAAALGGADRIAAVKSLSIEGAGSAPNAGQNRMPDDPLPLWRVNEYTRTTELANGRTRVRQVRQAQFLFAGDLVQRQTQALDGQVAYNVTADGMATRAGDAAAHDRHLELLHHPITAVRAALDTGATLSNSRTNGHEQLVDIMTAARDKLTLAIDSQTHLPTRVISMSDNPNMGDVAVVTTFADYEDVNGVKLPRRLTTKMDKYLQLDLNVTRNQVDADVADLAAPAAVTSGPAPVPPPVVVTAEPVGKGIWWLAGSGNHRSVVFEFADHLVLYEVPLNEARTKAVIDKAR